MRSIQRRFKLEQEKNPLSSDFICFSAAVYKQGFSKDRIDRWFKELVNKNEYDKSERKEILSWLEKHSNS